MMSHSLRKSTTLLRLVIISFSLTLLSACNILPEPTQVNYYELPANSLTPLGDKPSPYTLQLQTPYANRTLNTQRILVNPQGYELQAYQGAAWIDNAPAILRDRLAQALLETNLVRAMTFAGESGTPNIVLQTHLYRFQVHYEDGQPVVHVQLNAQLINRQTGDILAVKPIYVKQPVSTAGTDLNYVIPAFGKATDKVSQELTQWLYNTFNNAQMKQKIQ